MWLLKASFVISEVSGLVPGQSTCPALNVRPHGDWVMSFRDVPKVRIGDSCMPMDKTLSTSHSDFLRRSFCSKSRVIWQILGTTGLL